MKYNKGFANLTVLLIILGVVVVGALAYRAGKSNSKTEDALIPVEQNQNVSNNNQVVSTCTPSSKPSFNITYPNGGETFTAGQQVTVTWKSCNINNSAGITLSGFPYPSDRQFFVGSWGSGTTGSEVVTIPSNVSPGKYVMNVSTPPESNPSADDWSDSSFTIVSPVTATIQKYISGQANWPPVITTSATAYTCTMQAQSGGGPTSSTLERTINGKKYCITTTIDAAAGSRYGEYTYITANGSGIKTTNFTLKWPNCQNYDAPQSSECQSTQNTFLGNLDTLIDSLM